MSEGKCDAEKTADSMASFCSVDRRLFLQGAAASGLVGAASLALPNLASGAVAPEDLSAIGKEIEKRHDEAVQRLQEWIKQPSIAAENRGMSEGCDLTMRMLRDAGFQQVTKVPTDGQPGIFATLDAGAPKTIALYFMYDVKQADPCRVDFAAVRRRAGGQAWTGQGDRGSGRGEPEGSGSDFARGLARHPRSREEATREFRARRGRGRGNRLTTFSASGSQAGNRDRAEKLYRRIHALRITAIRWPGRDVPRSKGRRGAGAHFERPVVGTRAEEGSALQQ